MVELQREMGRGGGVVLEGRDIGTVVFPGAEMKFYLDAAAEERARRRFEELAARGVRTDLQKVLEEVVRRDENDSRRALAPLRKADDAILVDSTEGIRRPGGRSHGPRRPGEGGAPVKLLIAKSAGFCFGVRRAMEMAFEAARKVKSPLYSLGPLIHNPQAVASLEELGIEVRERIDAIPGGTVIFRSHGGLPRRLPGGEKEAASRDRRDVPHRQARPAVCQIPSPAGIPGAHRRRREPPGGGGHPQLLGRIGRGGVNHVQALALPGPLGEARG